MSKRGTQPESAIVAEIRLALGRDPRVVLWDNRVWSQGRSKPGLGTGSADLIGIVAPTGRLLALEVKNATGRPSREQRLFMGLVNRMGGYACIVRSADDAVAAVDAAVSVGG